MTTILAAFAISSLTSLVFTPIAAKVGMRLGAVDLPNLRKVHTRPIPRSGGMAVFLAFPAGWVPRPNSRVRSLPPASPMRAA